MEYRVESVKLNNQEVVRPNSFILLPILQNNDFIPPECKIFNKWVRHSL